MGSSSAYATAKAGEENHQFSVFEELLSQFVQPSHSLFCQRGEGSTTHVVKSVPQPENVNGIAGLETAVVGINEGEMGSHPTSLVGLVCP
jgi:hypothetical protein